MIQDRAALFQPDIYLLRKKSHHFAPQTLDRLDVWVDTSAPLDSGGDPDGGAELLSWLASPEVGLMSTINTAALVVVMRDDSRDPHEAYQAAMLVDVLRGAYRGQLATCVYFLYANVEGVAFPEVLPPIYANAMEIAFLQSINVVKDPVARLLNKTVHQRCMIRKFDSVALAMFKQHPIVHIHCKLWLLTSLLGNFPHAQPSSRPEPATRLQYYAWLGGYELGLDDHSSFLRLLKLCPHLLLFSIREYLAWVVETIPALREHFDSFSDFSKFKHVVVSCMDRVRVFFSNQMRNPSSGLLASFDGHVVPRGPGFPETPAHPKEKPFFDALNDTILLPAHLDLLKISYKRPSDGVLSLLKTIRKDLPLVPRRRALGEEEKELANPRPKKRARRKERGDDDDTSDSDSDADEDSNDPGAPVQTAFDLAPYLPQQQLQVLAHVVDATLKGCVNPAAALYRTLDVLEACGVPFDTTFMVKRLLRDLQSGAVSTRQYTRQLRLIHDKHPHAYNLLQAIVELFREQQRIRELAWLPLEFIQSQIAAIRDRYGDMGGGDSRRMTILRDAIDLVFCPVCDTIYSLVRDFNSAYVNNYEFGLRDALVDYTTDKIYCKREKTIAHRGTCGTQELRRICLLGRLVLCRGKALMLCPQKSCAMPMVLDAKKCAWNEDGPCCYSCSYKLQMKRLEYGIQFMTECARCPAKLSDQSKIFLYPHGVALCQKHHNQYVYLIEHLNTPEIARLCCDRASTINEILRYHWHRVRMRKEAMQPFLIQAVKRSKLANRSKRKC